MYVCQKSPDAIRLQYPNDTLFGRVLHNNYKYLEILYQYEYQFDFYQKEIEKFIQKFFKKGIKPCQGSIPSGYNHKKNLIWLVLNKKIKNLPLGLIKAFRMTMDDFINFPDVSRYDHGGHCGNWLAELSFEPRINAWSTDYQKDFEDFNKRFGLEQYTYHYCENFYQKILNYVDNKKL